MHFADRLWDAVRSRKNPICLGLDPRPANLPPGFLDKFGTDPESAARALTEFGRGVLDTAAPLVPVVKVQAAFYECLGWAGCVALADTLRYAKQFDVIVILDAKRNDIGTTAEAYAQGYLGRDATWSTDALTITPYLGADGIAPFVRAASETGRGAFALVRTSNPSAIDFQDLIAGDKPIYRHVAEKVVAWGASTRGESGYSLLGAVAGATYPEQLAELRAVMPGVPLLVPGFGAQGGTAADVASAFDENGLGAVINNSRGLTFAYERADLRATYGDRWQRAIEHAVVEMADMLATETPAGRLRTDT